MDIHLPQILQRFMYRLILCSRRCCRPHCLDKDWPKKCLGGPYLEMETVMIMLLTHRSEIREQLNASLHASGHQTCVPAHRDDVRAAMTDRYPELIVLDLYLAHPSGAEVLRRLRQDGYHGKVIVLSGQSMVSVLHDVQSSMGALLCEAWLASLAIVSAGFAGITRTLADR
jgi:CheY-like chemotaxis protein